MARAKKAVRVPEIGLNVIRESYQTVTNERTSDEPYSSRDDTHTHWTVEGVELVDEYPDVTACFPVQGGDIVYLVYVVYSTGDSFGHDADSSIAFLDVFKTNEKATALAKLVREHYEFFNRYSVRWSKTTNKERKAEQKMKNFESFSFPYIRENGEQGSVHTSWSGYFERLSYVEVVSFVVNANKRTRY